MVKLGDVESGHVQPRGQCHGLIQVLDESRNAQDKGRVLRDENRPGDV